LIVLDGGNEIMNKISVLILSMLFFSGCATTVYISSLTDTAYSPVKTDPIYIVFPKDARIADRQFYALLKREMISNEFNIVEDKIEAKYYLLFRTDSKTSQIDSTFFIPSTSTTSGYVGGKYYSGTTRFSQAVPYSYDYTVEKIYLDLYAKEDVQKEKYMTVWEGYIGAGKDEYKAYTRAILKSLLDVFGTNYEAYTPIDKKY
jgi:hypothetical protein